MSGRDDEGIKESSVFERGRHERIRRSQGEDDDEEEGNTVPRDRAEADVVGDGGPKPAALPCDDDEETAGKWEGDDNDDNDDGGGETSRLRSVSDSCVDSPSSLVAATGGRNAKKLRRGRSDGAGAETPADVDDAVTRAAGAESSAEGTRHGDRRSRGAGRTTRRPAEPTDRRRRNVRPVALPGAYQIPGSDPGPRSGRNDGPARALSGPPPRSEDGGEECDDNGDGATQDLNVPFDAFAVPPPRRPPRPSESAPVVVEGRLVRDDRRRGRGSLPTTPRGTSGRRRRVAIGGIVVTVLGAAAAALIIALTDRPMLAPSQPVSRLRSERFVAVLEIATTVSNESALSVQSTPQFKALTWLSDVDEADVPISDRERLGQRYIVAVLYFSTGGEASWSNKHRFLSSLHECEWTSANEPHPQKKGVICDVFGRVAQLSLAENKLKGSLPDEIGYLPSIEKIFVHRNNLSGSIPKSLCKLTQLQSLGLYDNGLTGSIPTCLGNSLGLLKWFRASSNKLVGTIPESIGQLTRLKFLTLALNELSGPIPATLNNLRSVEVLLLYSNRLSGTFPLLPGMLPKIRALEVWDNRLSGTLPSSVGSLWSAKVLVFDENHLTGTLPTSLGGLPTIASLGLHANHFSGTIPTFLGNMSSLKLLALGDNDFNGGIPSSLRNLQELQGLSLEVNHLSGTIPSFVGNMERLLGLSMHSNEFTGTIPAVIGNTNLRALMIDHNKLNGTVPSSFLNLSDLEFLNIARNNLHGNASFLCGLNVKLFIADCEGETPEVLCDCCNSCCHDEEENGKCDYFFDLMALVAMCGSKEYAPDYCADVAENINSRPDS